MDIRVTCGGCGKVLRVNEGHAGKTGRCPNCKGEIKVPTLEELKKSAGQEPEQEIKNCPTCGAYLNPNDVICISCYTNLATGEWELKKTPKGAELTFPFLKMATAVVLGVLVFMAGVYIMSSYPKLPPKSRPHNNQRVTQGGQQETDASIVKLQQAPEETLEQIRQKIQRYETYIKQKHSVYMQESLQALTKLEKQAREYEAQQAYEKLMATIRNKDMCTIWIALNQFLRDYQTTAVAQKVEEQKDLVCNELLNFLRYKKNTVEKLVGAEKYQEALMVLSPDVLQEMSNLAVHPDIQQALQELVELCCQSKTQLRDQAAQPASSQDALKVLRENYEQYLPTLYQKMKARAYNEVQIALEQFLKKLVSVYHDDPGKTCLYHELMAKQEDLKAIDTFWQAVRTGIRQCLHTKMPLQFQDGRKLEATVGRYDENRLYLIIPQRDEIIKTNLTDLAPQTLLNLALQGKPDDVPTLLSAIIFCTYEDQLSLIDAVVMKKLQQLKVPESRIAPYRTRVTCQVRKHQAGNLDQQKLVERGCRRSDLARRAAQLQAQRSKVQKMLQKMLQAYLDQNYTKTLDILLIVVKELPVVELKRMNTIFKQEHGYSLWAVADKSRVACPACHNQGVLMCPKCKGKGEMIISGKKLICNQCYGKGKITCRQCAARRHNQKYRQLVDFLKKLQTEQ